MQNHIENLSVTELPNLPQQPGREGGSSDTTVSQPAFAVCGVFRGRRPSSGPQKQG